MNLPLGLSFNANSHILISTDDHEMNLILFFFFPQERVYNLKVCFATKIIICQLLVGGVGWGWEQDGREEETSVVLH